MDIKEIINNELDFCKEIDAEKNANGLYIYESQNKVSVMNLPFVLQEYKQWLIDRKIVKLK